MLFDRVYSPEGTYIAIREPSYSILGHVIIVLGYCINLWFIFKAYIWFRKYGGIKGFRRDDDFDEEEAWKNVKLAGNKGSKILDRALDKQIKKEKLDENEALEVARMRKQ